ncbi:MAG: geranylgeranylglyceryl/heptaprenylglyceryl phosphate synthase [archaeon]
MKDVRKHIFDKLKKEKLVFTLLDPEKLDAKEAGKLAKKLEDIGSDAIMLGGSTTGSIDDVAKAVKDAVSIPIILFPSSAMSLSKHADAVFFMSLINSEKIEYLMGEQLKGSLMVKNYGLEPIGMGYIVINTGEPTMVEKVAQIRRLTNKEAVSCALAAEYFGMKVVYLEAGSGAQSPVPDSMISAVKKEIGVPLIVGGGINGPLMAKKKLEAGADIIVIGTVIEKAYAKAAEIIDIVKKIPVEKKGLKK